MGRVPFSGRTAVRQTLRSGHSAQRLFSMRHLKAIRASAPLSTGDASSPHRKNGACPFFGRIFGGIRQAEYYRIAASAEIRPHRANPSGRKFRDDSPALLIDRQSVYANKAKRTELFCFPVRMPMQNSPATVSRDHQNSGPGGCEIALQNFSASFAALPMSLRRYSGT